MRGHSAVCMLRSEDASNVRTWISRIKYCSARTRGDAQEQGSNSGIAQCAFEDAIKDLGASSFDHKMQACCSQLVAY